MLAKVSGIALVVVSDVALMVALAADPLGLGAPHSTIGYKQISLAVAAIVIQLAGLVLSQVEWKRRYE